MGHYRAALRDWLFGRRRRSAKAARAAESEAETEIAEPTAAMDSYNPAGISPRGRRSVSDSGVAPPRADSMRHMRSFLAVGASLHVNNQPLEALPQPPSHRESRRHSHGRRRTWASLSRHDTDVRDTVGSHRESKFHRWRRSRRDSAAPGSPDGIALTPVQAPSIIFIECPP